jgi:hypothetical protein
VGSMSLRIIAISVLALWVAAGCADGAPSEHNASTQAAFEAAHVAWLPLANSRFGAIVFDERNAYAGSDVYRASREGPPTCRAAAPPHILISRTDLATGSTETLLSGTCPDAISNLRVDATHLYYRRFDASGVNIRRLTINSPHVEEVVADDPATSIQVDGSNVYWSVDGLIRSRAKNAEATSVLYTASATTARVTLLGFDQHFLYFDQYTGSDGSQFHTIRKLPLAGGRATVLREIPQGRAINGFAMDSRNIYWSEMPWDRLQGSLHRVTKSGAAFHTIVAVSDRLIDGLAVTDTRVYWVETRESPADRPYGGESSIWSRSNPRGTSGEVVNEYEGWIRLRRRYGVLGGLWIDAARSHVYFAAHDLIDYRTFVLRGDL